MWGTWDQDDLERDLEILSAQAVRFEHQLEILKTRIMLSQLQQQTEMNVHLSRIVCLLEERNLS